MKWFSEKRRYPLINSKNRWLVFLIWLVFLSSPAFSQVESDVSYQREDLMFIRSLFKDKIYEFAEQEGQVFLKKYPDSRHAAEVNYILAQVHIINDRFKEAIKRFDIIVNNYPAADVFEDALYYAGSLRLQLKDDKGIRYLAMLEKRFPDSKYRARSDFHRGQHAFRHEQWGESEKYLKRMVKAEGIEEEQRLQAKRYLAWSYYFQEKTSLARSLFLELLESKTDRENKAVIAFQLGVDAQKNGHYEKAAYWYETQMEKWPHPEFQDRSTFWVAECLYQEYLKTPGKSTTAEREKAVRFFTENLNMKTPISPNTSHYHRAWLYKSLDRDALAEEDFAWLQSNVDEFATDMNLTAIRAKYYEENNKLQSANRVYISALSHQEDVSVRNALLLSIIRNSFEIRDCSSVIRWEKAADFSERDEKTIEISYYGGKCHYADQEYEKAIESFSRIPIDSPYAKAIFTEYLESYRKLKDFDGGMNLLINANKNPELGDIERLMGLRLDFCLDLEQWARALDHMLWFEVSVQEKREDPWFKLHIAKIADKVLSAFPDKSHPIHSQPLRERSYFEELALEYYEKTFKNLPDSEKENRLSMLQLLIERYKTKKNYQKEIELYREAIQLVDTENKKAALHYEIAKIYITKLNAPNRAQAELHAIHNKGDSDLHFEASILLAEMYIGQNNLLSAITIFDDLTKRVYSDSKWFIRVHFRLAELYQVQENWDDALKHYDMVTRAKTRINMELVRKAGDRIRQIKEYLNQ